MTLEYMKKAVLTPNGRIRNHEDRSGNSRRIEQGGDAAALDMPPSSTSMMGRFILSEQRYRSRIGAGSDKLKRDIEFAHANVKRFAEAQRQHLARTSRSKSFPA
jgi:sulfopropanediol 3-dehydrogenase